MKDLGISLMGGIHGYPIYVSNVTQNSIAMEKGVKRGEFWLGHLDFVVS